MSSAQVEAWQACVEWRREISGTGNGKWLGRRERRKRAEWCRGLESLGERFGDATEDFRWCWVTVQVCSLLLPSPRESVPLHKWRGEGGERKDIEIGGATSPSLSFHPGEIPPTWHHSWSPTPGQWWLQLGSGGSSCAGRQRCPLWP